MSDDTATTSSTPAGRSIPRSASRGGGCGSLMHRTAPAWRRSVQGLMFLVTAYAAMGAEFRLEFPSPSADRWMYPHNATPGTRPSASVFSSVGDASGVDTRHGQFLLGWDTSHSLPSGLAPNRYVVTSVHLSLTTLREGSFVNDSTPDAFESALFPEDPRYVPDADPGRPVELFGAGFRNDFTAASFLEYSPFGSAATGGRNAFAAGFNLGREFVDVGNNVGKTNALFLPFPTRPFAVGVITHVAAGEPVPADSTVTFELQLGDPDVLGYVQNALSAGRLWLVATWLGESGGFAGTPQYPEFATRDNLLHDPPRLVVEGVLLGEEDSDTDGLPDDWERLHLGGIAESGDDDRDRDGASNAAEFALGTDPDNAASVMAIRSLRLEQDGTGVLDLLDAGPGPLRVEASSDLVRWAPVSGRMLFMEPGRGQWRSDAPLDGEGRFLRVNRTGTAPTDAE